MKRTRLYRLPSGQWGRVIPGVGFRFASPPKPGDVYRDKSNRLRRATTNARGAVVGHLVSAKDPTRDLETLLDALAVRLPTDWQTRTSGRRLRAGSVSTRPETGTPISLREAISVIRGWRVRVSPKLRISISFGAETTLSTDRETGAESKVTLWDSAPTVGPKRRHTEEHPLTLARSGITDRLLEHAESGRASRENARVIAFRIILL